MSSLIVVLFFLLLLSLIIFLAFKLNKTTSQLHAITNQKKNIEDRYSALELVDDNKENVISIISHDLRGPLNTLNSLFSMWNDDSISLKEFTDLKPRINSQLQSVIFLLDNLIHWSKINEPGNIEAFCLEEVLQLNIALLRENAGIKSIRINMEMQAKVPVYGNKNQIDAVVRNILANAIKFTPVDGQISIVAKLNGRFMELSVIDTGVGMSDIQIQKIIDKEKHNTTIGTVGEKGTGLGLQLINKFVYGNGGSMNITSKINSGTNFTVHFPLQQENDLVL